MWYLEELMKMTRKKYMSNPASPPLVVETTVTNIIELNKYN